MFENMLYAQRRTGRLLFLQGVPAVVSVALYFALIPPFGARGAAVATLATFVVSSVLAAFLAGAPELLLSRGETT